MKKIDRRKAIKNLTMGLGGATLLSTHLAALLIQKLTQKQFLQENLETLVLKIL